MNLYDELATNQENQNAYKNAIDFLKRRNENLDVLLGMFKENSSERSAYEEKQIKLFLKVAELNYKLKYYTDALDCLNTTNELIRMSEKKVSDQFVI